MWRRGNERVSLLDAHQRTYLYIHRRRRRNRINEPWLLHRSHHKYGYWLQNARSESNLYIDLYRTPGSTVEERREVESKRVEQFHPAVMIDSYAVKKFFQIL